MLSSRPVQLTTDGAYFPTKTPGRGLKNRAENTHAAMGMAMTVNGKGKSVNMAPRTPFQPASAQLFKKQKTVLATIGRPLMDKTPLPNRINTVLFKTPVAGKSNLSKLPDDDEGGTPESAQRPSSMRKHIKHPRLSGQALETPMNSGKHWDVSDGEIMVPDVQPVLQETIVEDDDDMNELEYGAPNTLDLPYQPPFDFTLPDYKQVGKTLFQLAHSIPYDDIPPPVEQDIAASQLEGSKWDMFSLPELESDDPFHLARIQTSSANKEENASRAPKRLPRPQSSLARVGASNATRPAVSTNTTGHKRAATFTSTRSTSTSSTINMAGKPVSRPAVRPTGSTNPAPLTSARSNSSLALSRLPAMASKPRVASTLRRPHTALAISTKSKANTSLKARKPDILDAVIINDIGTSFDEDLNFKFDV